MSSCFPLLGLPLASGLFEVWMSSLTAESDASLQTCGLGLGFRVRVVLDAPLKEGAWTRHFRRKRI